MDNKIVIEVNDLTKIYKLYDKPTDRLKESLHWRGKTYHKDFYALNQVSFSINKGETVGIIGKNGSGKSTLLKIITGVLTPTRGNIKVNGKVSALLELGAGFNPEYTGIENIYFQGNLLGYSDEEMSGRLPQILDFADIGDFIYQPVKMYSSGMFARLAFSVAINVEPDILIVDEALSVGDIFFQSKCYNKFKEFQEIGKTILFVTHDMGSIVKYCQRAIFLNNGEIITIAPSNEAVLTYKKFMARGVIEHNKIDLVQIESSWKDHLPLNSNPDIYGNSQVSLLDYGVFNDINELSPTIIQGEKFSLKVKFLFKEKVYNPIFAYGIIDAKGHELIATNTINENIVVDSIESGKVVEIEFSQRNILKNGIYLVSFSCTTLKEGELIVYIRGMQLFNLTVISDKYTTGLIENFPDVMVNEL